jgi:small nuclear ribonucleoprotein (snRNP)-like protein
MATADAAAAAAKEAKPQTPPPAPAPAAAAAVTTGTKKPLYLQYPLSSTWEIVLTNDETITGEVYCTDPIADVVVLQDVSDTIRMISVASIRDSKQIKEPKDDAATINGNGNTMHSKKAMEEREKRAIRLAQESFRHLNAKVSYYVCMRNTVFFFRCLCIIHLLLFAFSCYDFLLLTNRLLPRDK